MCSVDAADATSRLLYAAIHHALSLHLFSFASYAWEKEIVFSALPSLYSLLYMHCLCASEHHRPYTPVVHIFRFVPFSEVLPRFRASKCEETITRKWIKYTLLKFAALTQDGIKRTEQHRKKIKKKKNNRVNEKRQTQKATTKYVYIVCEFVY